MQGEAESDRDVDVRPAPSGCDDNAADAGFDRDILSNLLAHGQAEAQRLNVRASERLGLTSDQWVAMQLYLGKSSSDLPVEDATGPTDVDEEELMVRELLMRHRSIPGEIGVWLSCIIARRGMEPNHLWEDLGLALRPDLSRLMDRHFHELAAKNTRNMRWKRFLYRALCEEEGFSMCPSPTCDACSEFQICYSTEPGEAVLVLNKKQIAAE
jgi:nitrogen fixation protein NifQ